MAPIIEKTQVKDVLNSQIVLKLKQNEARQSNKFKACVFTWGYKQLFERDYGELYAPVISSMICLLTLIIGLTLGWPFQHVYVTAAFLNGDFDLERYIQFQYNLPNCILSGIIKKQVTAFLAQFEGTKEPLKWYFGMQTVIENGCMELSQTAYIDQILTTFGLQDCQTYATPISSIFYDELTMHKDDPVINGEKYQKIIGCLQFL